MLEIGLSDEDDFLFQVFLLQQVEDKLACLVELVIAGFDKDELTEVFIIKAVDSDGLLNALPIYFCDFLRVEFSNGLAHCQQLLTVYPIQKLIDLQLKQLYFQTFTLMSGKKMITS